MLVVDDTVVNVKVITKMLEKLGFRMIRTAFSGTRALEVQALMVHVWQRIDRTPFCGSDISCTYSVFVFRC